MHVAIPNVLSIIIFMCYSLAQTDAKVASQSVGEANVEIKESVAEKQWERVDEASSKLSMVIASSKRAAN